MAESKKFDPVKLIGAALAYVKHVRLMLLMIALGVLAGMIYFSYTTPLYRAQSLVFCQAFGTSLDTRQLNTGAAASPLWAARQAAGKMSSQQMLVGAARRLGLVGEMATYESVREHIPVAWAQAVDTQYIRVEVQAYDPEVVRRLLLGNFFLIPSAPFPPKARGRRGFDSVLEASSGPEALKCWQKTGGKVDLLLTDIVMPDGMSGKDLGRKLRAESPNLLVIYTSGYNEEMVGRDAWEDGNRFLAKPFRPNELLDTVRSCLQRMAAPASA